MWIGQQLTNIFITTEQNLSEFKFATVCEQKSLIKKVTDTLILQCVCVNVFVKIFGPYIYGVKHVWSHYNVTAND